jgi:hypothetical protein
MVAVSLCSLSVDSHQREISILCTDGCHPHVDGCILFKDKGRLQVQDVTARREYSEGHHRHFLFVGGAFVRKVSDTRRRLVGVASACGAAFVRLTRIVVGWGVGSTGWMPPYISW